MNEQNNINNHFNNSTVNNNLVNNNMQPNIPVNNNTVNINNQPNSFLNSTNDSENPKLGADYKNQTNPVLGNIKPRKMNIKILIAIILAIIVIALGVVLTIKLLNKKETTSESILSSSAFFLPGNNELYALFNEDGKQITEFIFDLTSEFINGTALVENENGEYAIINEAGKYIVNFGEYEYINKVGTLYKVADKDYNEFLIDAKKNVITPLNEIRVQDYGDLYVLLKDTENYGLLNYVGKNILTIKRVDTSGEPRIEEQKGYAIIFYNNETFIVNLLTGKLIANFKEEIRYDFNSFSSDDSSFVINNDDSWINGKITNYKVIYKDEIVAESSGDFYDIVYINDYIRIRNNGVGQTVLNKNGKKILDEISQSYYIMNDNSYIMSNGNEGIDFYKDNQKVATVNHAEIEDYGVGAINAYLLNYTYNSEDDGHVYNTYQFYDENGNVLTSDYYDYAEPFDEYGYAKVKKDDVYYLIDKEGKKVTDDYEIIRKYVNGLITLEKADGSVEIVNEKLNKITETDNNSFNLYETSKEIYLIVENNNIYSIYNYTSNKKIVDVSYKPDFEENYFVTSENGKTNYYSYKTGKIFYQK